MQRARLVSLSPLRLLERSLTRPLARGELGVVMARAGAGKTAFLVHVGIDAALREQQVLHLALGQRLEHVHAWYDGLFNDLARACRLEDKAEALTVLNQHRVINAAVGPHAPAELERALALYASSIGFRPTVIIVDGHAWEAPDCAAVVTRLKAIATNAGATLWMSAQTHREVVPDTPDTVVPPCQALADQIAVAVFLQPTDGRLQVRLLKGHQGGPETPVLLAPDTLTLTSEEARRSGVQLPPSAYTLLSGGAAGAEAEFGAMAERFGVAEINYSFAGHDPVRRRGLVQLGEAELQDGAVSDAYVRTHLRRALPDSPQMRHTLHSIWHQVVSAGEVFVVGELRADDTVRGGTGWAAELARHLRKPLYVFDQERDQWFTWREQRWEPIDPPEIHSARFCGTGTKHLTAAGRLAIERLYARSFVPG